MDIPDDVQPFVERKMPLDDERAARRLATFLHNEFCESLTCGGARDYMESARNLLPKLREFL